MEFKTRVNRPDRVQQGDFPHIIPQYEMQIHVNENNQVVKTLVQLPEEQSVDIYEKIQSDNHGLDVYDLLKRYGAGDPNAITFEQWCDGDFSAVTGSLLEMNARLENAKGYFESAPLEVRQHYDSDIYKFLNGVDSGEYFDFIKANAASAAEGENNE